MTFPCESYGVVLVWRQGDGGLSCIPAITPNKNNMSTISVISGSVRPEIASLARRAAKAVRNNAMPIASVSAAAVFILMAAGLQLPASAAAILSLLAVTLIPQ